MVLKQDNRLTRNSPTPLYEQLKNVIEQQILAGNMEPGEQIPSERELCTQFGVSRVTVRQAVALAVNEGLLHRTHGRGTFVADHDQVVEQSLSEMQSFHDSWSKQGGIASTRILKAENLPNDLYLSRLLNIKMQERIVNLQLLGSGNQSPVVYYNSYFSHDIGNRMVERAESAVEQGLSFSTLDLYRKGETHCPTHVEQTFESMTADRGIAEILQVDPGFPVLLVTSIIYQGDHSLEYKISYYRADKYKFFITRKFDPDFFGL